MYTAVENKEITTTTLLTLINIVDSYLEYRNDISKYINIKKMKNKTEKLYKIIKNDSSCNTFKDFLKKHDYVISVIKKNNSLEDFTLEFYNNLETLDYYYHYIKNNQNDLNKIKDNIHKIDNLGINKIILDEEKNFSETENSLSSNSNCIFNFYENMEVIPYYDMRPIKYKTTNSHYLIRINITGSIENKNINIIPKNIEVTSLTFSTDLLPNELTYENTVNIVIKNLCEKDNIITKLKDVVDLDISVYDFIKAYNALTDKTNKIKNIKNDSEIKNILENIYNNLVLLDTYNSNFKTSIINSTDDITLQKFETEKQLCLKSRKKRYK